MRSGSTRDWLTRRFPGQWSQVGCAGGGAIAAALAVEAVVGPAAMAISRGVVRPAGAAPALAPYLAFVLIAVSAVGGILAALGLHVLLARRGKRWVAVAITLFVVSALGAWRARWLGAAGPLAVLMIAPLLVTGRVRPVVATHRDRHAAIVCLACEAACGGIGVWLPFSVEAPALLLPGMLALALVATHLAALPAADAPRWRLACAGLPLLLLPLAGLSRNPTLVPAASCLLAGAAAWWLQVTFPVVAGRFTAWARRHAIVLAVAAVVLVLVVPWHFRDMAVADNAGHEGQHLGWINSISFGKLMMADAGFTYGPAREYTLAFVAWLMGGATLEHVRLAHVAVNVAGLLCLLAAMHRVSAGQVHTLLLGVALLVTHSALVAFVVYTTAYSFGWADAARAGLATLAVVVVLSRRRNDARSSRRRLVLGGALAAFATLYSHDFGLPAVLATWTALASEALVRSHGDDRTLRARARVRARDLGLHAMGVAMVLVPFLGVYAARGRLGAFFEGYRWAIAVSSGATPWSIQDFKVTPGSFASYRALVASSDPETAVGARVLDYVISPAIAILGLCHVAAAIVRRRFVQRTALILGLALLDAMTLRHSFIKVDPWHLGNGGTPGLVLLVALMAGGRRLLVRLPARHGLALPAGVLAASLLPVLWLANGAWVPVNTRLARIASGDERPSFGAPYRYADLPRAGDLHIGNEHLGPVRYIREHSRPDQAVLCMTWDLGGGMEAFLSERRNPIAFDKPDEIVTRALRDKAVAQLEADPPELIVGTDFGYLGDEGRWFIQKGWHTTYSDSPGVMTRNR